MNKKEFEKLVRPYLIKSPGQRIKINTELILRDFKYHFLPTEHHDMITISELNKLIYMPDTWNKDKGYLVFSNESEMYIYYPQGEDKWYEAETSAGWSSDHAWVKRLASITAMNNGKGWNVGEKVNKDTLYYALEPHLNSKKYLNWMDRNPLEVKK
jgi:hypothetical protein